MTTPLHLVNNMAEGQSSQAIPARIASLRADPDTGLPTVILEHITNGTRMAVPVGLNAASAIATELNQIALERPTTHQLMAKLLIRSGVQIVSVELCDYVEGTFYAAIHLIRCDGAKVVQDARPSDAFVLALQANTSIFVDPKVVRKISDIDSFPWLYSRRADREDELEGLCDDVFGEWKM